MRLFALIGAISLIFPHHSNAVTNLTDVAELSHWVYELRRPGATFSLHDVMVTAVNTNQTTISVRDKSRAVILHGIKCPAEQRLSAGNIVSVSGLVREGGQYTPFVAAYVTNVSVIARCPPEAPLDVTPVDFLAGKYDCHFVRISGHVRDIVADEIDRDYFFLILSCADQTIYVPCNRDYISLPKPHLLLGARVSVTGVCDPSDIGGRRNIGRLLNPMSRDAVHIDELPPRDPFDVQTLESVGNISPNWVSTLGPRRVSGEVIAILQGKKIILQTRTLAIVNVSFSEETTNPDATKSLPAVGDAIDAIGFPVTDLYRINLAHARWRSAKTDGRPVSRASRRVRATSIRELVDHEGDDIRYNPFAHGWTVRLTGRVGDSPRKNDSVFPLVCDGLVVAVDATSDRSSLAKLIDGCTAEVTGVCVMDSENWQANFLFPQIRGFRIAVATPTDIRIIARPPWWTPGRLFVLVSALIVILVFILIWNASLRLLAERRGRALFRSQIAEVESELRVNERTRLAVELHDSISQNLAAISYEIAAENLPTADKMLRSCRTELRRCIWDLRNDALDEPDFNNAIRQTLAPVIGNASLGVDFNIVRARLNDTTAHAILSILRELAYNAVHHGRARNVHIVGEQTQMEVHFSLRDDGCGFDVQNCPGPSEGHFGLSGIRDRIGQLGGLIEIKSTTGAGTFVFVTIKTSNQEVKSHETYHRSPC